MRSKADFGYGYREALADRVVRPVVTGCPAVDLSEDDTEYLGLPGLLSPEQMASLLASRDAEPPCRVDAASRQRFGGSAAQPADGHPDDDSVAGAGDDGAAPGWRQAVGLRREINQLVGRVSARTGSPHAAVHSQLRAAVARAGVGDGRRRGVASAPGPSLGAALTHGGGRAGSDQAPGLIKGRV